MHVLLVYYVHTCTYIVADNALTPPSLCHWPLPLSASDQANRLSGTFSPPFSEEPPMNKIAQTHTFRKLLAPARCRECDNYVYFHGSECEQVSTRGGQSLAESILLNFNNCEAESS